MHLVALVRNDVRIVRKLPGREIGVELPKADEVAHQAGKGLRVHVWKLTKPLCLAA